MPARPHVVLFDIDGTLMRCGGAGARAIARAYDALYGRPDACAHVAFGGMTDRAIARLGLEAIAVQATEDAIDALITTYLDVLEGELRETARLVVFSAAVRLAEDLRQRAGVAVGLGTGNVERGARLKLARAGIDCDLPFGGFGCDAEARGAVLAAGVARGAARLGRSPDEVRVTIIGDTPKDVAAARAIGARCVAVATGSHSVEELVAAGAHVAVASLDDDAVHQEFGDR